MDKGDAFGFGVLVGVFLMGLLIHFVILPSEKLRWQKEAIEAGHAEWVIIQGPPDVEYEFQWKQ